MTDNKGSAILLRPRPPPKVLQARGQVVYIGKVWDVSGFLPRVRSGVRRAGDVNCIASSDVGAWRDSIRRLPQYSGSPLACSSDTNGSEGCAETKVSAMHNRYGVLLERDMPVRHEPRRARWSKC